MLNVYISCHDPKPANELAAALTAAGYRVVSEWHTETGPRPDADNVELWKLKAERNLSTINTNADVLVLIAGPERYPGGKFVEAGWALAHHVLVLTLGGIENGMLHHPKVQHVENATELVAFLAH